MERSGGGGGGQGGCEPRIEVIVKMKKKLGRCPVGGEGGQGGGERRIKVVKIQKILRGVRVRGVGVRVDVYEKLKLLKKCKRKSWGGGGG